ncbi:acyl-CoA dehydrogenase family protein [Nocardia sp. NPDC059240]|uniref:acyl-CoA dehydrogenase family protein n=1 Tax=Nocardia sp. NPDC059240 TaxID=3346786 RepID=UPI0036B6A857
MTVQHNRALAEELETGLGDPHDPATLLSFQRILRYDELEEFPHELVGELQRRAVHEYCLPAEWGGRAGDVETGFLLLRLVARRDPTTAAALMLTDLAFMPTWIGGNPNQRTRFVSMINNGAKMAWGLSEREHGSDVLSNDMRADKVDGGYLLTGEKWLIGIATLADVVTVHARTGPRGGPGDWSVFAVEKRLCSAGSVREVPNERLHGLRALDLSGIRLDEVFVPDSHRIGAEGQGLELVLKSAQVARTVISGIALGATDTALRVTCDFIVTREIFGQKVAQIPYTRRQVAESFADLLLAEAVATGGVRGLQACPEQAGIFSAIVKYFVPTTLERTLSQLSLVLGARLYLREHPHYGIFQKMLRDILVSVFADGNTVVNLKSVGAQLETILTRAATATPQQRAAAGDKVALMYDLDAKLATWTPGQQQLFCRDGDIVLLALPDAIDRLRELAATRNGEQRAWLEQSADLADRLLGEVDRLSIAQRDLQQRLGRAYGPSAELYRLAEQYCALHAGAAIIHLIVESTPVLSDPFPDGAVLLLCLERVWRTFHPTETLTGAAEIDRVTDVLLHLHGERKLFSHWQIQVSASGETDTTDERK